MMKKIVFTDEEQHNRFKKGGENWALAKEAQYRKRREAIADPSIVNIKYVFAGAYIEESLRHEIKAYCALNNLSMSGFLRKAFRSYIDQNCFSKEVA